MTHDRKDVAGVEWRHDSCIFDVATVKPIVEIADIFRLHFDEYLQTHHCTPEEFAAANAIMKCRTAAMGGHMRCCDSCGHLQIAYNSCNNRNCPKCGAFEKAQWLANQAARLIPVPHFQVVFTVDHLVKDLAYVNPQPIYDLLFATANQVLKEFAQRYLGGKIGVTAVLHTWGQTMQHHVHLHCMVTGGALVSTATGDVWRSANAGFLFPVVELSAAFRDAFCKGLTQLAKRGELRFVGACSAVDVAKLVQRMQAKKWEVFIGAPPKEADVENLLGYFSRYVYRSAISNSRIRMVEQGQVTFEFFNNKERAQRAPAEGQGTRRMMALSAIEFIRRFLRHVLPFQYKRVRHFGLYAGNKRRLQMVRMLVSATVESIENMPPKLEMGEWLTSLGLADAMRCAALPVVQAPCGLVMRLPSWASFNFGCCFGWVYPSWGRRPREHTSPGARQAGREQSTYGPSSATFPSLFDCVWGLVFAFVIQYTGFTCLQRHVTCRSSSAKVCALSIAAFRLNNPLEPTTFQVTLGADGVISGMGGSA